MGSTSMLKYDIGDDAAETFAQETSLGMTESIPQAPDDREITYARKHAQRHLPPRNIGCM